MRSQQGSQTGGLTVFGGPRHAALAQLGNGGGHITRGHLAMDRGVEIRDRRHRWVANCGSLKTSSWVAMSSIGEKRERREPRQRAENTQHWGQGRTCSFWFYGGRNSFCMAATAPSWQQPPALATTDPS